MTKPARIIDLLWNLSWWQMLLVVLFVAYAVAVSVTNGFAGDSETDPYKVSCRGASLGDCSSFTRDINE